MRWRHPHSLILGTATGALAVSQHRWLILLAFAIMFALGAATTATLILGVRLTRRLNRALPDAGRTHPCAQCQAPVTGRNRYCGETCREIAADERAERRRLQARFEEYGGVPF